MRATVLFALSVSAVTAYAQTDASATSQEPYTVVEDWPKLPDGFEMGEAAGVGVDSHGHVWVFHRGTAGWSATRSGLVG